MLATHWDGYPASLGLDLLNCQKSVGAVIEVAKAHTIDAADAQIFETLNRERITLLAGKQRGNIISGDDFVIADITIYRDLAEFQYDIRGNAVYI